MAGADTTGDVTVLAELAELTTANLPLAPGLRAMAAETPRRRPAAAMLRIAERLEQGTPLDAAVEAEGSRFPAHVRGLVLAAVRSGRVGDALHGFVALEQDRLDLRRRIRASLAYPVLLCSLGFLIIVFYLAFIVPEFGKLFADFGTQLPDVTRALMWIGQRGVWHLLAVVALIVAALSFVRVTGGPAWAVRIVDSVPIVGSVWRWQSLSELCRTVALMLDQQLPLPEAFRLTGLGVRRGDMKAACRRAAEKLEAGEPIDIAMDTPRAFPPSLRPFLDWGERNGMLASAFRSAAEMFEGRVRLYAALLEHIAAPLAFILVWGLLGFIIVALFLPLFSLIQMLS